MSSSRSSTQTRLQQDQQQYDGQQQEQPEPLEQGVEPEPAPEFVSEQALDAGSSAGFDALIISVEEPDRDILAVNRARKPAQLVSTITKGEVFSAYFPGADPSEPAAPIQLFIFYDTIEEERAPDADPHTEPEQHQVLSME